MRRVTRVTRLAALGVLISCDAPTTTSVVTTDGSFAPAVVPVLPPPAAFVPVVTNPFFPLAPGTVLRYRSETDEGVEIGVVTVTNQTRMILGIAATVVHDEVFLDGVLIEDTFDWYAQDNAGNVWYLGEASCEIVNQQCVSTEGSWEAGIDGAAAGIIMWADPAAHKGESYSQEIAPGVAEDRAKVLHVGLSVTVPVDVFDDCVETMDWTPLEPGSREHKFYCPGTGLVLEVHPRAGNVRNELITVVRP